MHSHGSVFNSIIHLWHWVQCHKLLMHLATSLIMFVYQHICLLHLSTLPSMQRMAKLWHNFTISRADMFALENWIYAYVWSMFDMCTFLLHVLFLKYEIMCGKWQIHCLCIWPGHYFSVNTTQLHVLVTSILARQLWSSRKICFDSVWQAFSPWFQSWS